jgi:hypothetical protein
VRRGTDGCLYQRGCDIDVATKANEWMYINFWKKDENAADLDGLLRFQERYIQEGRPDDRISMIDGTRRRDQRRTAIRVLKTPRYPTPEYTGFVELDNFIFFCVLFSPVELEEKNLRKLRYVLRRVLPLKVKHG